MGRAWSVEGLPPALEAAHAAAISAARARLEAARAAQDARATQEATQALRDALEARRYSVRRRQRAAWERAHRRTLACKVTPAQGEAVARLARQQHVSVSTLVYRAVEAAGLLDIPAPPPPPEGRQQQPRPQTTAEWWASLHVR